QAVRSINGDVQNIAQIAGELLGKAGQVLHHSKAVREDGDRLLAGLGDFRLEIHAAVRASVEQLAKRPELASDVTAAERLLADTLTRDSRFELFYLVDSRGVQISENVFAADVAHGEDASCRGRDWSQRPWFRAVAERMESHITQVYRSSATDDFCFTVSVPIVDERGQLLRVLGADVRLSALV
ncbi:MAG: methyl-accepting chemotaxis protein, partial [Pseudomonas sp.]|nr:methyl-accepting chemotaxis protein [Pseudomonas sp.]